MFIRLFFLWTITAGFSFADEPAKPDRPLAEAAPKPHPVEPPTREEIDGSIRRGVDFLLADQRPDGCWGSAERTKELNIYAPVPGAHHAFRSATTALCVTALLELQDSGCVMVSDHDTAPTEGLPDGVGRPAPNSIATAIDRGEA